MGGNTRYLVRSGLLLACAVAFQLVGRNVPQINQFLVGPIINAILLASAFLCGTWWGIAIGALTPVTAFLAGQLNPVLGPFIPFIILGNAVIIIAFGTLKRYKLWGRIAGVVLGSFLKFGFLVLASRELIHIINISFDKKGETILLKAMGSMQLITALIGGCIALVLIEAVKNKIDMEDYNGKHRHSEHSAT